MNRKNLSREYAGNLTELRKIINSFDLIPNAPNDEFDSLIHKILSHLYKGFDLEKINKILQSELIVTYGLYDTEFDERIIADKIFNWWILKNDKKYRESN